MTKQPDEIYVCDICGEFICEGEEYIEIEDKHIHFECFNRLATRYILDTFFGVPVLTAKK